MLGISNITFNLLTECNQNELVNLRDLDDFGKRNI